ncbi:hypothetical protein Zmor_023128 [Zophobas morio]|uniref:DUF3421 domain containing protein n=1 Tax=Zophobas morio TaxID=2755281 RepID=A0AA38HWH3_9CUCU|nr:hypothetical protein Zmor_023128 [Zophobas morio]
MKSFSIIISGIILFTLNDAKCQDVDYYWRDYNGVVPFDAFPGGTDINGNDTYIGQVYVHGHGLFIGQIIPGTTQVDVACYGVKKRDYIVKILCTQHKDNFSWLSTTWTSFHVDTINKHAVVGGYDHVGNKGALNIGRVMHQGILKIGQVASFRVEQVYFYFAHKNRMEKAKAFEVLIYDKNEGSLINPRTFIVTE